LIILRSRSQKPNLRQYWNSFKTQMSFKCSETISATKRSCALSPTIAIQRLLVKNRLCSNRACWRRSREKSSFCHWKVLKILKLRLKLSKRKLSLIQTKLRLMKISLNLRICFCLSTGLSKWLTKMLKSLAQFCKRRKSLRRKKDLEGSVLCLAHSSRVVKEQKARNRKEIRIPKRQKQQKWISHRSRSLWSLQR